MPALFAYLFSLLVFIGSGYAGLIWLTEPAAKTGSPPMAVAETTAGTLPHKERSKAPRPVASDVGTANLGAPTAPGAETTPAEAKDADNSDVVSGTTAQGSAVDADTRSIASRGSEQDKSDPPIKDTQKPATTDSASRAPAQNEVVATSTSTTSNGVGAQESHPPSETTATENVSAENPQDKPVRPTADTHNEAASGEETSHREITTRSSHRTQQEAKRDTRPRDRYDGNRKTAQQASRSKLVMMTLQTIEFPDGHREHRLVPLRHSWAEDD